MDPLLERFARAERPGVFLDFDGTLSDIVDVPSEARPVAGAKDLLERLGRRFSVAAVVSGRSAHQLLDWLGSDVEVWGVHGAQRTEDGAVVLSELAAPYSERMAEVHREAERKLSTLDIEGVIVEDKGIVLNLHYRSAPDRESAEAALLSLAEELAAEHDLVLGRGRLTLELKPPVDFSKQDVLLERARAERLDAVMFVGDDTVDLPAFDALDDLRDEDVFTLRVAVRSDESPAALLERADVVVDGPAGVVAMLQGLLSRAE